MIEIIPAIDIIDGKCVRLRKGDFDDKTSYGSSPVEAATRFRDAGLRRLHMVDLDGAKTGTLRNLRVLEDVAAATGLEIDFGGGVRAEGDVASILCAGASMINVGSIILSDPATFHAWVRKFGREKFLPGVDSRAGFAASNGWAESTGRPVIEVLSELASGGFDQAFVTDVDSDGMMQGPAVEFYRLLIDTLDDLRIIASGGVRSVSDIEALEAAGCSGVIIGKAFYEGEIDLKEVSKYVG